MARTARPRPDKAVDPAKALLETLKQAIEKGVLTDLCLEVASPLLFQAKRGADGQYRTVNVTRGEEFVPIGVRQGKRGDAALIFEFRKIEADNVYEQFELDDNKVWTAFPELESLIVRTLGFDATDTDDKPTRFRTIKPLYLSKVKELEEQRIEDEKLALETKEKNAYKDVEGWGTWG